MNDQTPATELRAAAAKLRAFAAEAGHRASGPWIVHEAYGFLRVDNDRDKTKEAWTVKAGADLAEENRPTAEYIALMHPGVGLALADWLEATAGEMQAADGTEYAYSEFASWTAALAVARQFLGQVTP
jgi:hypothetical protein